MKHGEKADLYRGIFGDANDIFGRLEELGVQVSSVGSIRITQKVIQAQNLMLSVIEQAETAAEAEDIMAGVFDHVELPDLTDMPDAPDYGSFEGEEAPDEGR